MKKSLILLILVFFVISIYSQSGDSHWKTGKHYYDKGNYSKAIKYFKKATEKNSQGGDFFRWLGHAYYENKQYQEAVDAYKQALRLPLGSKAGEYECWRDLSNGYKELGKWDSAISARMKSVVLKPDDPDGFLSLSKLYNWNEQFEEAITAAKRAIELKSDFDYAYYQLGFAYRMKNQYSEAFSAIKKAIEINPAKDFYYSEIANLFYDKEDYAEAIESLKRAIELQPADIDNHIHIANCYRLMGKYDDSIAAVNKVIALQTYTGIGMIVATESGYLVAKEVMETGPAKKAGIEPGDWIREINGKSTKGMDNEKTSQILRGTSGTQVVLTIEREGARKSIDKTVTRETIIPIEAASSFGVRSIAYRHKGNLEAALQDAEKAYSLDPANDWARSSLGAAYLDRGQYDDASKLLAQVKDSPRARILEATVYAKQEKMKEAIDIYCSIPEEKLSPKNMPLMNDRMVLLHIFKSIVKGHRAKAKSFEAQGRYQDALSELSEALKLADETEAQAIQETLFNILKRNPSLAGVLSEEARRNVLRGEMLVKEGSFEKAAAEFKQAIRIAPYAARLYYNLALVYAELKKYPEAIRQMKTYLQAVPDASDARAAKDGIIKWEFMMEKEK